MGPVPCITYGGASIISIMEPLYEHKQTIEGLNPNKIGPKVPMNGHTHKVES